MKNKKKYVHVIVGGNGQDAHYLTKLLIEKKEKIILITRRDFKSSLKKNKYVSIVKLDICNQNLVFKFLRKFKFLKIYHLASYSPSINESENSSIIIKNLSVNIIALVNFLEYALKNKSNSKIFYACSSHIYNETLTKIQNENTKPQFNSNYALTKYLAKEICAFYRKKKIFCSVGIMYSHASKLSKKKFLIKDIFSQIKNNKKEISVMNKKAKIDLLSVTDVVNAIYEIMNLNYSDEFIISSNKIVQVKDVINEILKIKNIKSIKIKDLKKNNKNSNLTILRGNNNKLIKATKWSPKKNLKTLVNEYLI